MVLKNNGFNEEKRRADLVHPTVSAPNFCNISKLYFSVSENYKFYFINTYTYYEYSYKLLVEITFYFELRKNNKFVGMEISVFFFAEICHFSSSDIYTVHWEFLYVCVHLISDFLKSQKIYFSNTGSTGAKETFREKSDKFVGTNSESVYWV
jgi:hypothetical protein